jgi:hypothetical protein
MKKIDKFYLMAGGTLLPGFALVAAVAAIQGTKISAKDGGLWAALIIGSIVGAAYTNNALK